MPLFYLRRLTGIERSDAANRHLARFLAFIAGAVNAGGLLAVGQYTSHMSGIVSRMADNLAGGSIRLTLGGLSAVLAFLGGAFLTTLIIRWARARGLHSQYALPLIVEAAMLVIFGLTGHVFEEGHVFLNTVLLLCFTMGLQNAMITKISNAIIRTTHLTGMVTDIGIALGRIVSMLPRVPDEVLHAESAKLRLHSSIIVLFFFGGFVGAIGFRRVGFLFTLPLAAVLLTLAVVPVVDDLRRLRQPAN